MTEFKTIVILQPGAIGDVILGTPVAVRLKDNYPNARVVYYTHPSLFPLLRLCPAIDDMVEWKGKAPLFQQLSLLKRLAPDLVVDLTSSLRTRLLRLFSGARHVGYRKQPKIQRPVVHVADGYMQTVSSLHLGQARTSKFPTLTVPADLKKAMAEKLPFGSAARRYVAVVPGVGKHRPNRAWPSDSWVALTKQILAQGEFSAVLVGGPDDADLCARVETAINSPMVANFAGKLSLPETAALLHGCEFVVSADTGPSHIGVAVGKQVIGLMGPTLPERSGPYGMQDFGLNVCYQCQCQTAKRCLLNDGTTAGVCMGQISVESVAQLVERMTAELDKSLV